MKTMSKKEIIKRAERFLHVKPFIVTNDSVNFHLPAFTSIYSRSLVLCDFPYFFITPIVTSDCRTFLELVVFTNDN